MSELNAIDKPISRWSEDEVKEFAFKGNHLILHQSIQCLHHWPDMTWGQAMQLAAVSMSCAIKERDEQISNLVSRSRPPWFVATEGDNREHQALEILRANHYDHHTPHMICVPTEEWDRAMQILELENGA